MKIETFVRASDRQIESAGGDAEAAQRRMLDWHAEFSHNDGYRMALGDFAVVPGKPWKHHFSSLARGLDHATPLNGGEVGASTARRSVSTSESLEVRGIELIRHLSGELLLACMEADPRGLIDDKERARRVLMEDRQFAPTGYLAVADIAMVGEKTAEFDITQVGDVFVALDTGGRVPHVLQGSLQERAHAGEVILGEEKQIDLFKGELKTWISTQYPHVSDQFFYDLIFNGTFRPQFTPQGVGDVEAFKAIVTAELRQYACTKYAAQGLTDDIFDRMIEKGMTPWQQLVAQNNPAAGPFWYPALDPVGDTPEQGVHRVRFHIDNVLQGTPVRLTMWTDGSVPAAPAGIAIGNLKGLNAYGEQTRLELQLG